ncbi:MAG TPA: hypothetical protein ENN51_08020, partial [candidate division WOR-3 bacterium]|nr:hypothetical protein [candidate division WOR-3 bacterium]
MLRRLSILLLAALLTGCGGDIIADSAELDRALVPAIDLTRHQEPEPARAAMAELLPAWEEFRERYHGYRPADPDWAAVFAEIDTLIADVADIVEDGDDFAFAAANLVDMRMMLAELRGAAGIEYYLDVLAELWEPAATGGDRPPAGECRRCRYRRNGVIVLVSTG